MSVRRKKVRGDWDTNNCLGSSKLPSSDGSSTMSEGWGLSSRELEPGASSPRPKPAADGYRKPHGKVTFILLVLPYVLPMLAQK